VVAKKGFAKKKKTGFDQQIKKKGRTYLSGLGSGRGKTRSRRILSIRPREGPMDKDLSQNQRRAHSNLPRLEPGDALHTDWKKKLF